MSRVLYGSGDSMFVRVGVDVGARRSSSPAALVYNFFSGSVCLGFDLGSRVKRLNLRHLQKSRKRKSRTRNRRE